MKHASTREFFSYWDRQRGTEPAPDRSVIEPEAVRDLLGDIFVLSYDAQAGYPFRVAGTRVCALLGRDAKDTSFSALFSAGDRREIEDIIAIVAEETRPAVVGIDASTASGTAHLELLLLPFAPRAHAPISVTGSLAPFGDVNGALRNLRVTSFRYIDQPPQRLAPRPLNKVAAARGFIVYEGVR
jgi:hypothetical protein